MPLAIETVTIDCTDAPCVADIWLAALGHVVRATDGDWRLIADPSGRGAAPALDPVPEGKVVTNRIHLDFFRPSPASPPGSPGPRAWSTWASPATATSGRW